jgi:hypothetical protein
MTVEEAKAWLRGERSMINLFMETCTENENANLMTTQADAAMMQQAYWVLMADKADLFKPNAESEVSQ